MPADRLQEGYYVGYKCNVERRMPPINNIYGWYLMGYFLGNGIIKRESHKFFIVIKKSDDITLSLLQRVIKLTPFQDKKDFIGYECVNKMWYTILIQFGVNDRMIPQWVIDAPVQLISHFIKGYKSAYGKSFKLKEYTLYNACNANIALGLQRMFLKYRKVSCDVTKYVFGPVNEYKVRVYDKNSIDESFIIGSQVWYRIERIHKKGKEKIYDIEMRKNGTFVVENLLSFR